jgi:hypothetical protein
MTDDGFLSFEEEIALAAPLTLDKDQAAVCDRRGCEERATQIVPGCVLCPGCASMTMRRSATAVMRSVTSLPGMSARVPPRSLRLRGHSRTLAQPSVIGSGRSL